MATCTDIDKARRKMFAKKTNVKQIPLTKAALERHVKRATYQGGHMWGQSLLVAPALPLPTSCGWTKMEDGLYESNWMTLPEAKVCCEFVSCKCKKGCVKHCRCKQATLEYYVHVKGNFHKTDTLRIYIYIYIIIYIYIYI